MASHGPLVVALALFLFGLAVTGYIHATSDEADGRGGEVSPALWAAPVEPAQSPGMAHSSTAGAGFDGS